MRIMTLHDAPSHAVPPLGAAVVWRRATPDVRTAPVFVIDKGFGETVDCRGVRWSKVENMPISSEQIYEVISIPQAEGALFTHGFTYSGHPVCCAAALKNIEIMERTDLCGHVRSVGKYFEDQLKQRIGSLPLVGDVRGSHFMMCIESVADKDTKELLPADARIGNR